MFTERSEDAGETYRDSGRLVNKNIYTSLLNRIDIVIDIVLL